MALNYPIQYGVVENWENAEKARSARACAPLDANYQIGKGNPLKAILDLAWSFRARHFAELGFPTSSSPVAFWGF